jgi:tRNA U34 5-methylaminomethyl-2-thiouridine-forming methyltransferase MnmC
MDATKRRGADVPVRREVRTTADGSRTLFDVDAGQTLHSEHGAASEARHVFLEASGASARLARGRPTRVLEVGLGVGLNLLVSADAARAGGTELHYRALDLRLPAPEEVAALELGRTVRDPDLASRWRELLEQLRGGRDGGTDAILRGTLAPGVRLELALGEATAGPDAAPSEAAAALLEPGWAHAVYHDAFSPAATPELWSDAFLGACARCLAPGGTWVSYSVAGAVRRRLAGHGLRPEKLPGPPGGKREMLRAVRPRGSRSGPRASPRR